MKIADFVKKNRTILISAVIILLLVIASLVALSDSERFEGDNPIDGFNPDISQVLVSGEVYSLDSDQWQDHVDSITQNQKRAQDTGEQTQDETKSDDQTNEAADSDSGNINDDDDPDKNGQGGTGPGQDEFPPFNELPGLPKIPVKPKQEDKTPKVETDLVNGETVSGNFKSFYVTATDYKKNYLGAGHYTVSVNGGQVYGSTNPAEQKTYYTYDKFNDDANEIVITVTDKEGNSITLNYTIYVDTVAERPSGGTFTLKIEARTLSLGTLMEITGDFYQGENVAYALDRLLRESDLTPEYSGQLSYGFYLKRLYKPGITDGWSIPVPIKEKLDAENVTQMPHHTDALGEADFYERSGWVYLYNGDYLDTGMATVKLYDGDVVTIAFTTHYGHEYDGTWFSGNW